MTWVHDFGTFKMILDEFDADLSRQIRFTGSYSDEKLELTVLKDNIKPRQTVLDLGANLGFYSILTASLVGKHGRVFAFEPLPRNAELIKASLTENLYDNITVINAAVSNRVGKTKLYLSPYYTSEHSLFDLHYSTGIKSTLDTIDVELITIDGFMKKDDKPKIDFIKMDIEGSEGHAIEGMENTIRESKKMTLLSEYWPNALMNSINPKEYLERLSGIGFKIFHIDGLKQAVYPVTVQEMLRIQEQRNIEGYEKYKEVALGGWYTTILCKK
jgi:FkbM family methyltransferase